MKKSLVILIALIAFVFNASAQVGIGRIPHAGSILDLTNPDDKYLLLPQTNVKPDSTSLSSSGAIIYYQGKIYLNAANEIKVLTPWQWNGNATGYISSDSANPVVIGTVPTLVAPYPYRLQVADALSSGVSASASSKASILIGDTISNHLVMDNNEIMAKTNPTTAGVLKLQKEGGIVDIRMSAVADTNTVLRVNGSIDAAPKGKIRENGNDLVPEGLIIMWQGAIIPQGWALCDGSTQTTIAGGTIITPDLRERFIVGGGPSSGYVLGNEGGINSSAHIHNFDLPLYTSAPADGAHVHGGSVDATTSVQCTTGAAITNVASAGHTHTLATNPGGGNHSHSIDVIVTSTSGASAIENRPPYYALVYLIKL